MCVLLWLLTGKVDEPSDDIRSFSSCDDRSHYAEGQLSQGLERGGRLMARFESLPCCNRRVWSATWWTIWELRGQSGFLSPESARAYFFGLQARTTIPALGLRGEYIHVAAKQVRAYSSFGRLRAGRGP